LTKIRDRVRLQLEGLRVARQVDVARLGARCHIKHSERSASVPDDDLVHSAVDPDVVGIVAELDRRAIELVLGETVARSRARRDARHRLSLLQTDVVIGAIRLMMFRPPPAQPVVKLGMDGEAATLS
jgi:hypothetical protein